MKHTKLLLLALISATLFFTACEDDNSEPTIQEGTVNMMFEYKVGEEAFEIGKTYTIGGTAVQIDLANFYVGGITLMPEHGDGGTPVSLDGKYLLVTPDAGAQELATIETGHWHEIEFFVGVGPTENSQSESDFTNRPSDDPLAIQEPPMHWNWNAGYRFIRVDGMVDTDGDGTVETLMQFHIGTDAFLTNLSYEIHKDVEEGANMVHFEFDLEKAFEGIDLKTEYETHTGNNLELANKFRDNIENAIAPAHE